MNLPRQPVRLMLSVWAIAATSALAASTDWQRITPAGASCWDGSPWHFFYRTGTSQRLAIFFGSGDACWSAPLCAALAHAPVDLPGPPAAGLFDGARAANPLADFAQVWLPDCTFDMQTGDRTVSYQSRGAAPLEVAHVGAANVRAALAALQTRITPPREIFVGGDGSGGIAAAYWSMRIGERWPSAQLVVLGAGAGGYRSRAANDALTQWGALDDLPDLPVFADRHKVYFESFYIATAQRFPEARLGAVNFANDAVQRRLMRAFGTPVASLSKPLQCNMNEVRINAAGFHSFMVPGTQHAILGSDAVYALHCEAQNLSAWIGDLVSGEPIETHWCDGELTLHTSRTAAPL